MLTILLLKVSTSCSSWRGEIILAFPIFISQNLAILSCRADIMYVCITKTDNHQSLTHSLTNVGIELLGQLKILDDLAPTWREAIKHWPISLSEGCEEYRQKGQKDSYHKLIGRTVAKGVNFNGAAERWSERSYATVAAWGCHRWVPGVKIEEITDWHVLWYKIKKWSLDTFKYKSLSGFTYYRKDKTSTVWV